MSSTEVTIARIFFSHLETTCTFSESIKYDEYLSGYLDPYSYCLLPNHFHLFVRVKEVTDAIAPGTDAIAPAFTDAIARSDGIGITSDGISNLSPLISEQFRRFFIGYSQAINKQQGRTGSLFAKNFKRIHIDSESHLLYLVYYIHANPQRHRLIDDFRTYPYSSYSRMLIDKPTKLRKKAVVEWFGSKKEYLEFHGAIQDLQVIEHFMIED